MKNRFRRIVKKQRKLALDTANVADSGLDKHLGARIGRIKSVKRFIIGWIFFVLLASVISMMQYDRFYGQTHSVGSVRGGIFREGVIGRYTNPNPVFASGSLDSSVSKLVFSGLLKHDEQGNLVGDLASHWSISPDGKEYTVTLKNDISWHDGKPVTAHDVAYTYHTIQNPDARSPLQLSWKGVDVRAKNDQTVVFTLKGEISSFAEYLTNGIIPEHIYKDIDASQLRSSNTIKNIVGAGPFRLVSVESQKSADGKRLEKITLAANDRYQLGRPNLDQYIIQSYANQAALREDLLANRLDAAGSLDDPEQILANEKNIVDKSAVLNSQVNVFFKTSLPQFSDSNIRKALVLAIDRKQATERLGYPVKVSDSPFLDTTFAYDSKKVQKTNQLDEAKKLLDAQGWTVNQASGIREKSGQKLEFSLTVREIQDYREVSESLVSQWKAAGISVKPVYLGEEELRSAVSTHNYEALFAAINIGNDPDVYTYWHSSQKDIVSSSRLNLSEYSSKNADTALETGRARSDKTVRAAKYGQFLNAWMADNPALTLYQPRYSFLVREPFYGFSVKTLSNNTDRYDSVHKWAVKDNQSLDHDAQ